MNDDAPQGVIPEHLQQQLRDLETLRDRGDRELNFRRLSGRRFAPDLRDMSDLELNQATQWYRTKINSILAPYEV